MNSRGMAGVLGWTAILLLSVVAFAAWFLAKVEVVDGKGIDAGHIAESVSTFTEDNGLHGTVDTVKNFYVVIEANGKTSTYTVEYGTFVKAMTGQTTFKMWCTPFSCTLLE